MKTIVGLFDNFSDAEAVVRDLESAGFERRNISIIANQSGVSSTSGTSGGSGGSDAGTGAAVGAGTGAMVGGIAGLLATMAIPGVGPILAMGPLAAMLTGAGVGAVAGGLIGALTGAGVPEEEARYYEEGVRRGGTLVTVAAQDEDAQRAIDIMNRHNPVDIEERSAQWRQSGYTPDTATSTAFAGSTTRVGGETADVGGEMASIGGETSVRAEAARPQRRETASAARMETDQSRTIEAGKEAHIPVVEEELRVGKREVQRGGIRVYSRVEEKPVEEQVNLREEHVKVERRPVERAATEADFDKAFQQGSIEVTERAEEAVVSKQARVVEEVVVGKEATERTETVRDTVRRTDVEVEQIGAGTTRSSSSDFDRYDADFRSNFQQTYRGNDYTYDQARSAYRYGYDLAGSGSGGEWSSVESDARSRWEQRNPGTWEKFKDAARFAYDRARQKASR